ncbi:HAD family hydrolase [Caedibacter taeniospiralis]|jgi:2-phosphoglycolate phosphatase|uniref:HAD family hydrolase n=1 Tax=Caedibacter taeniospiralis TaxID=28907 RepID=UPI0037BF2F2C
MSTTSPRSKKKPKLKLVLFDLDGTLLDSSTGIFSAIQYAFTSHNLTIDFEASTLRQHAGRGVEFLLQKINNKLNKDQLLSLKHAAFSHYQTHAVSMTHPFQGVKEIIETLKSHAISWGIVTSKTRELTESVLAKVPYYDQARIVVCADDLNYKKPHPMPLIYAVKTLGIYSQCCAYVGDTKSDMLAAKHAHCYRIFAEYGYEACALGSDDYDFKISNLEQLRQWIISTNA